MKHGETRNQRIERHERTQTLVTDGGEEVEVLASSGEGTVSETWCAHCQKWVVCRGITSSFFCPVCSAPWDEEK